jgi:hypothetical protein
MDLFLMDQVLSRFDGLLDPPKDPGLLQAHAELMGLVGNPDAAARVLLRIRELWASAKEAHPESLVLEQAPGEIDDVTAFVAMQCQAWTGACAPQVNAIEQTLARRCHSRGAPQWLLNCPATANFFLARANVQALALPGDQRRGMINGMMATGVLFVANNDEVATGTELVVDPAVGERRTLLSMKAALREAMPQLQASTVSEHIKGCTVECNWCRQQVLGHTAMCLRCQQHLCSTCGSEDGCRVCLQLHRAWLAWCQG